MYESFFNLTMKPFDLLPNPDFLFLSKSHRKVLMFLDYGIQERAGFILLTGPVGSGKTTIIRDLIKKRDRRVVLSKIFNTKVNSDQLLAMINDDFGLSSRGKDKITLLRELNDFLIDQFVQGNQPILIIDEAQNLSVDLLEEIRMLSNLETDQTKLLQIILVGQPELRETLASPALMQLRQRMKINCTIQPLTAAETEQYILHRLETAGNRYAVLFSCEALDAIFAYSRGIPRLINIICDFLMLAAFAEETTMIGREIVTDIIGDLDFEKHFWGETSTIVENPDDGDALTGQRTAKADTKITATTEWIRDRIDTYGAEPETFKQDTFPERPALVSAREYPAKDRPAGAVCSPDPPEDNGTGAGYGEREEEPAGEEGKIVKEGFLRRVFSGSGFKIFAALGFLFLSTMAGAAEFTLHSSLTVSEEYTDNVFETSANKRGDFITRAQPGFDLQYTAPFWDWNSHYAFDYSHYARGNHSDDMTHNLGATGHLKIINEFMFLDVSDTYSRVSLDVNRDASQGSLFVNQSDCNTFTGSPYFLWRLGTLATLKTGYRYVNTWYRDPTAINRSDQSAFAELSHEFSQKASVNVGYTFTHEDAANKKDYDKHDANVGGRYEYADKSFVFGQVGYTWMLFSTTGSYTAPTWNAGITHDFGGVVATLKTDVSFTNDPLSNTTKQTTYSADVSKTIARGSVGLNLSYAELENIMTERLQTRSYVGTVRSSYELLPKLTGTLAFTAGQYDRKDLGGSTRNFYVDSGLSYLLGEGLTVALNYKYSDYSSVSIAADNHQVNRVILEVKKTIL